MADNVNDLPALPIGATANNVPGHIDLLKDAINGGSIIRRLTSLQIAALTGVEITAGIVVYNTTTNKLQISTGAAWVDVDAASLLKANVRAASISGNYTSGGIAVAFDTAMTAVPTVTISCVPSAADATPLTVMVYGVDADGFSMRIYSHGTAPGPYGAFAERATGTPYSLDYHAIVL